MYSWEHNKEEKEIIIRVTNFALIYRKINIHVEECTSD